MHRARALLSAACILLATAMAAGTGFADAASEATFFANIGACERYDLQACHRISTTPLLIPGTGMSPVLDRVAREHTRFNSALNAIHKLSRLINECTAKKRLSCEAALAIPGIPDADRTLLTQLQTQLPTVNLDEPSHFLWFLVLGGVIGLIAFRVLIKRSPAAVDTRRSITNTPASVLTADAIRDPQTAQSALTLAHSYLSEIPDTITSEIADHPESAAHYRSTLALLAKQLDIAQHADPTATLTITGDDGLPVTFTQQWMRGRAIQFEALSWSMEKPQTTIQLLTQAAQIDPSSASIFHSLGTAHFLGRNRAEAIKALTTALALDPANIDIIKLLDRARNISDAEIATYKMSDAATTVAGAGAKTWGFLKFVWAFGPLAIILYIIASFTGSMSETFHYFAAFIFLALIAPAIKWVLNILRHN